MPKRPSSLKIYSLVTLMTTWWSLNYIVAKYALREFPPLMASGIRMIFAGSIMLAVYSWRRSSRPRPSWTRSEIARLIVLGILGVGLNQFFFVLGISMTTVSHAAIMVGLSPITVLFLAAASGLEKLSALKLTGMVVALCGVGVLQLSSSKSDGATLLGDLLVYGAAFTFALYTVRGKRETAKLDGVAVNTFAYVGSAVAMLPVTVGYAIGFDFARVTWVAWASLLYMAVFPSVICYSIYYYALTHVPASRVSAFSYLQPLLATTMAIPLLGEHPTKSLIAGGALVLAGVFLAERG
ncbi:MAG TPA: DMT family transporter [Bryobacteraceae bacterium]|nr:DMT family transporter [Bryobacteraceae bacterium]